MMKDTRGSHTAVHLYMHQGRVGGLADQLQARLGELLGKWAPLH